MHSPLCGGGGGGGACGDDDDLSQVQVQVQVQLETPERLRVHGGGACGGYACDGSCHHVPLWSPVGGQPPPP